MVQDPWRKGRFRSIFLEYVATWLNLLPFDFSALKGRKRKEYFAAIQAGFKRDYTSMEKIFSGLIGKASRKRRS